MEDKKGNLRGKQFVNAILVSNKAFLMAIIMVVILIFLSDVFMTEQNLMNLLRQMCSNCIIAVGFTFVIGYADIDLSVGAVVAFVGVVMAICMKVGGFPVGAAIMVGLATGIACGLLNATIISTFNLPAFIVTLATQSVFRGLVYIITDMTAITQLPEGFIFWGQGYVGSIPVPVFIMVAFIIVSYILANRTMIGRHVVAGGGNPEAARASGISITKTRAAIYIYMGMCVAMAAIIMTARTASAQVNAGSNMELDAIASVVMGGTLLMGGKVNIVGTIFGALIIALTSNGLNLLGVQTNFQIIAKGLLILLALVLDSLTMRFYNNMRTRQALAAIENEDE